MTRWIFIGLLAALSLGGVHNSAQAAGWSGRIKSDKDLRKKSKYWRSRAPWVPSLSLRAGMGFRPNYFAPGNAKVEPYVSTSYSISSGIALRNFGVRGYWSDLSLSLGWGFSKALTENIAGGQYARQVYARDIGVSLGKMLFKERNTGIVLSFGAGFVIPISLRSRFTTLITSISPRLSVSKSFFKRLSLSYSFGANFNFYHQDTPIYDPTFAGIPGLNRRWGMSHSFGVGFKIIRGLSVRAGVNIGVGYSFADAYQNPDGPQVFGAENLSTADLASYSINESNGYSISFGISYRLNRFFGISIGYANGGRQYEFQFNSQGERVQVIRNPFRLQNGSFSLGLSGSI